VKKAGSSSRAAAYIVKRGDTLSKIARIYGVTPEDLRQWNDLKRQAKLQPGRALQVVAQTAKSNHDAGRGDVSVSITPVRYRVRRGDTLWEIARVHDVTPDELRRWNDLGHKAPLLVGQELRIRVSES
jgi:membrane-bound lytic murein transglycosylase D